MSEAYVPVCVSVQLDIHCVQWGKICWTFSCETEKANEIQHFLVLRDSTKCN